MKDKYYENIKEYLIDNEIYKRVKDYSKNKHDLSTYYNVGKELYEAGKHYGEGIIKKYSINLTDELGKGYTETNLKYYRQFYLFLNSHTLCDELSWSPYRTLLSIKNIDEVEYYIFICRKQLISVRELQNKIKNNEYERLPIKTKSKLIVEEKLEVKDLIPNPIIIRNKNNIEVINEKILHQLILEDIEFFMSELGNNYSFIGSEYKIKIGNRYNYIDIFLFNIEFNCYTVVELKTTELKKEHIGQIEIYMNYIDSNIKKITQDKTIGIIICKKDNKYIIGYRSDKRILSREYEMINN